MNFPIVLDILLVLAEKLGEALHRGYFTLKDVEYRQFQEAVLELESLLEEKI